MILDDPKIFQRMLDVFSGIVYPRPSLSDLVENEFLSLEDRRHRKDMRVARTAIAISLVVGTLSSVGSIYVLYKDLIFSVN